VADADGKQLKIERKKQWYGTRSVSMAGGIRSKMPNLKKHANTSSFIATPNENICISESCLYILQTL
jgi:hypothetical protein